MADVKTIGATELGAWLNRSGRKQQELADELHVHATTVSQWLLGDRTPGLSKAVKIEALTGIPPRAWTTIAVGRTRQDGPPISPKHESLQGEK